MKNSSLDRTKKRLKILLVDEDFEMNQLFRNLLTRIGYEVFLTVNGSEAVDLARRLKPDLIILEIKLPGLDGFEICRQVKNDESLRDISIMFLTVFDEDKRAEAFQLGATDFISKPFNPRVLEERIRTIFVNRQLIEEKEEIRDSHTDLSSSLPAMPDSITDLERQQTLQEWSGVGTGEKITLALVFTDIVGSTDLANTLGDKKWFEVVQSHFMHARKLKNIFGGYEIKLIGDAYMAAFKTADHAFLFAWHFYNDTGDDRIKIRVGINVGQVRVVEDDLFGVMVNYTSRIQHELSSYGIMLSDSAKIDVMREIGTEAQEFIFRQVERDVKSFGKVILWFVAKRGTSAQESKTGRVIKKHFLGEPDLIPPLPSKNNLSRKVQ
jgi:DNA-binding response OmpR family regulator